MPVWNVSYRVPSDAFPLGERVAVDGASGWTDATFIALPMPYVFVAGDATAMPDDERTNTLERVRLSVAEMAGLRPSDAVPKVAVVGHAAEVDLFSRTRIAHGRPWHPGAAASGLLALGVALTGAATVPTLIGVRLADSVLVGTPAGPRRILRRRNAHNEDMLSIQIVIEALHDDEGEAR